MARPGNQVKFAEMASSDQQTLPGPQSGSMVEYQKFIESISSAFWRLIGEIPTSSSSGYLGQRRLTHVEMIEIFHAFTLVDTDLASPKEDPSPASSWTQSASWRSAQATNTTGGRQTCCSCSSSPTTQPSIFTVTDMDMMVFMDQWVRMDGNTKFHMTFVFNGKRNAMELVINQVAANQIC